MTRFEECRFFCGLRLARGGEGAQADGDAVPGVHEGDDEGEVNDLGFGEMGLEAVVNLVGGVGGGDVDEGLGPGEGGFFAVVEERALVPGGEAIEALLGFAFGAGLGGVKVAAIDAAVDLGDAEFDERAKFGVDGGELLAGVAEEVNGRAVELVLVGAGDHDLGKPGDDCVFLGKFFGNRLWG
jgi:hypothetical protein